MNDESFQGLLRTDEIRLYRESLSIPAPRCVRLRPDRIDSIPASTPYDLVPWFDRGRLFVDSSQRPSRSLRYAAADYYIQDAGSLLALALLDAQPSEAICDLCAAPGGKASGIAESLGEFGFLLANEPIGSRSAILRYALSRTGNLRHAITQQDPEHLVDRFEGLFDAVLVDAPCSGQTMVTRGKREANAFDPKQVEHSAARQRRILLAACLLLKPGGRLIYSTCTFAVEENEAQIRFLRNCYPNCFEPIVSTKLANWASPIEPGCYRLWPHRDPTSGAFAAGLKLNESISTERKLKKKVVDSSSRISRDRHRFAGIEVLSEFGKLHQVQVCGSDRGEACGLPIDVPKAIAGLLDARELPKLATCRNGVWKPEFLMAMLGRVWFEPHRNWELSIDQARRYMQGEALSVGGVSPLSVEKVTLETPFAMPATPWTVATWGGKPLGWAKFAGNRINNHLPSQAILTMGGIEEFTV